jgi:hypothetical protein
MELQISLTSLKVQLDYTYIAGIYYTTSIENYPRTKTAIIAEKEPIVAALVDNTRRSIHDYGSGKRSPRDRRPEARF